MTEWQLKNALRKIRDQLGQREAAFVDSIAKQQAKLSEAQLLWAEDIYLRHVEADA